MLLCLLFVFFSLFLNTIQAKEYIGSLTATNNVSTPTIINVTTQGVYYINPNQNDIKIKWPRSSYFETIRGATSIDPETTFKYGDQIAIQALSVTHNVYIGIYREN